uniref:ArsR family transcriptional regulator n=1 Tax=Echinostoma caproni TaxID=27848 RepID=A0A183B475_9TREM
LSTIDSAFTFIRDRRMGQTFKALVQPGAEREAGAISTISLGRWKGNALSAEESRVP